MLKAPGQQISLTDPDARSMKSRGAGVVGYNVQTAVDSQHHMIVAHEVTNQGSDRRQLANMAKQAKTALAVDELTVFADRGYYPKGLRRSQHYDLLTQATDIRQPGQGAVWP